MASQFSFSEEGLTVNSGREHIFASNCLKRKLEANGCNGFSSVGDHESVEQEYNLNSEKRQRFSADSNGHTECLAIVNNDENSNCQSFTHNRNIMGNDSLLQNNVECDASIGWEEVKMDCVNETVAQNRSACWEEHVTSACPPNLNNNVAVGDVSVEISGRDSSPTKGSPAREFLQTSGKKRSSRKSDNIFSRSVKRSEKNIKECPGLWHGRHLDLVHRHSQR